MKELIIKSHTVTASKMEGAAIEPSERLSEYCHEYCYIFIRFFGSRLKKSE